MNILTFKLILTIFHTPSQYRTFWCAVFRWYVFLLDIVSRNFEYFQYRIFVLFCPILDIRRSHCNALAPLRLSPSYCKIQWICTRGNCFAQSIFCGFYENKQFHTNRYNISFASHLYVYTQTNLLRLLSNCSHWVRVCFMSFLSLYASSSQTLYILISLVTSEISPATCLTAPH